MSRLYNTGDIAGADPGFLKGGGGVQARIQDFSQAPRWTLSA